MDVTRDLARLLRPRSVAVIGGGEWCRQVIRQLQRVGFSGAVWPVHPAAREIEGLRAYRGLDALPCAPDAAFVGINRTATISAVKALAEMGAGGAVCFASGFSEASAEDGAGPGLQRELVAAAGKMAILGPNCYGYVNALDGAVLWPDQQGCAPVDRGVAILTQSSNIAINLTMQRRSLPIGYMITCGNMAQTTQAEIATDLLDDPRVSAIGLHIEGFGDLRAWETLAAKAYARGVPMVALKAGRSAQARAAAVSHTASLTGGDAGAQALLDRLGIPRVDDLPTFLETLKLMHMFGRLPDNTIATLSCSGGEASLAADIAFSRKIAFPALSARQHGALRETLGPKVALANPLDYHTYIWRDSEAMARTFAAMTDPAIALTLIIADYPHTDAGDWECVTEAAIAARAETGARIAVAATLPELMPVVVAERLLAAGVLPMLGLTEALAAVEAAAAAGAPTQAPLLLPGPARRPRTLSEAEAKVELAAHGLVVPRHRVASRREDVAKAAAALAPPLALKGLGFAHKSEAGAVRLNLASADIGEAAAAIPAEAFLIEEMIGGGVAELLIGISRDPAHGFVLTMAAGGVLTELLEDSVSLLVPAGREKIETALATLRIHRVLAGYRGRPAAFIPAILDAIEAVQDYALANADRLEEVEVNPLICATDGAVAADVLLRKA